MELVPPPHLSPSSIGTFQQCPLKFKFSRIDGMTEPPTEATLRGNFVHSVFEELYSIDASDRTIESARLIAKDLWDAEYSAKVAPYIKSIEDQRMFRWSSWWCIENLWKIEDPMSTELDGIETELNSEIGGVTVKGFIDRWQILDSGNIVISDYKTGKVPSARYQDNKFFQLMVYAHILRRQIDKEIEQLELLFVKDGVKLSHALLDSDLAEAEAVVVGVKQGIDERCASGEFEPNRSRLCDWCSFKRICPAWSK